MIIGAVSEGVAVVATGDLGQIILILGCTGTARSVGPDGAAATRTHECDPTSGST